MTDIITYCDVITDCRECPIYAQTCDGEVKKKNESAMRISVDIINLMGA